METPPFYTISFQGQKPKAQSVLVQRCLSSSLRWYYTSFFLLANTEVPEVPLLLFLKNSISKMLLQCQYKYVSMQKQKCVNEQEQCILEDKMLIFHHSEASHTAGGQQ